MIVERFTWHIKPGHQQEFVELVKAERERVGKVGQGEASSAAVWTFSSMEVWVIGKVKLLSCDYLHLQPIQDRRAVPVLLDRSR